MATWMDGAAYAPVERPDGFATPVVGPLSSGAPYRPETPGPMSAPQSFEPSPPQRPLQSIGHREDASRDPREAFAVASSLVTAGPDAPQIGPRDPRTPFRTTPPSPLDTAPPPPTGPPLAVPGPPSTQMATRPPGHPFDLSTLPPPQVGPPQQPVAPPALTDSARTLARVAGGLCLLGFFVSNTVAFMLVVAGLIGLRLTQFARPVAYVALGAGAAAMLLQFLLNPYDWAMLRGFWAFISLGSGIAFLIYASRRR